MSSEERYAQLFEDGWKHFVHCDDRKLFTQAGVVRQIDPLTRRVISTYGVEPLMFSTPVLEQLATSMRAPPKSLDDVCRGILICSGECRRTCMNMHAYKAPCMNSVGPFIIEDGPCTALILQLHPQHPARVAASFDVNALQRNAERLCARRSWC